MAKTIKPLTTICCCPTTCVMDIMMGEKNLSEVLKTFVQVEATEGVPGDMLAFASDRDAQEYIISQVMKRVNAITKAVEQCGWVG